MSNTIELLDKIGADASLRNASPKDLECALDGMHASEALRKAAASGDKDPLLQEFGNDVNLAIQVQNNPHDGGLTEDDGDDTFEDAPSREDDDQKDDDR